MNLELATVLALAQSRETDTVEPELPNPPNGATPKAQGLWYALLSAYELNLGEMAILEQLTVVQTQLDEIEEDWRRDGSPTTSLGSMQQLVTDPRIQELRMLRAQFAALIRQLNLPNDSHDQERRPGRPTRLQSAPGARWGS